MAAMILVVSEILGHATKLMNKYIVRMKFHTLKRRSPIGGFAYGIPRKE